MSYIPNTAEDQKQMLGLIGIASVDELFNAIPDQLRIKSDLDIPGRLDQISLAKRMQTLARKNADAESYPTFLGAGVYDHYVPPTVAAITGRSEFYTSYTPYQPEVSQGTLQSIFEFQSLICGLSGMDIANASMYDGASALAEAAIMAGELTGRGTILVPDTVDPRFRDVITTYLRHMKMHVEVVPTTGGRLDEAALEGALSSDSAALILQHPNFFGNLEEAAALGRQAQEAGALFVVSYDPISLGLLTPPGEYDADIAVADGQSLGCPMGFGGPLLGLFGCKQKYLRRIPGRLVGQTTDVDGKRAFVMTLRTREQDIRRERATSNICTNVALYALAASVYLATMGKAGLRQVAELCVQKAHYAAAEIAALPGFALAFPDAPFFKEFAVRCPRPPVEINEYLFSKGVIGGLPLTGELSDSLLICVTEQRTRADIDQLVALLGEAAGA